jgi:GntR family transcriptional regulator
MSGRMTDPVATSLGPTAQAVRDRLAAMVEVDAAAPGARIGAERELAETLGVSRSTLRAALDDLERSGLIRRSRGRGGGVFRSERKVERDLTSLSGLPAYLRRQGFESDARVLSTATIPCSAEAAADLGLIEGDLVLEVVRVRLADREPISLERAQFPAARFPGLLDHSLGGSLYELLQTEYRLRTGEAEERIEVVSANTGDARLLGVGRGDPLIAIARVAMDAAGVPFERSYDLFRADRVRIVVRTRSAPEAPARVGASVQTHPGGES